MLCMWPDKFDQKGLRNKLVRDSSRAAGRSIAAYKGHEKSGYQKLEFQSREAFKSVLSVAFGGTGIHHAISSKKGWPANATFLKSS
jgi:hypothetical protein